MPDAEHHGGGVAEVRFLSPQRERFVSAMIEQLVPSLMSSANVPGLGVVLRSGGRVVMERYFGEERAGSGVPVGPQSVFHAASSSKICSTFGVMRLVDQGVIDLDAPVQMYLKTWQFPERMTSKHDVSKVTMRGLLSHTAGIGIHAYPWRSPELPPPTASEALDGASGPEYAIAFAAEPGTQGIYSGGGFGLIEKVVEDATGEDFAAFAKREILDVLGMGSSAFNDPPELVARLCTRHDYEATPLPRMYRAGRAGSNLLTTPMDYSNVVDVLLPSSDGKTWGRGLLREQTAIAMRTLQYPDLPGAGWGLGWYLGPTALEQTTYKAAGAKSGTWTYLEGFPQSASSIVIMTNGQGGQGITKPLMRSLRPLLKNGVASSDAEP